MAGVGEKKVTPVGAPAPAPGWFEGSAGSVPLAYSFVFVRQCEEERVVMEGPVFFVSYSRKNGERSPTGSWAGSKRPCSSTFRSTGR